MTTIRAISPSADAFPRIVPLRPTEAMPGQPVPHLQCPLYRPDSSSFAASLRELEKVMWGGGSSQKGETVGLGSAFGDCSSLLQSCERKMRMGLKKPSCLSPGEVFESRKAFCCAGKGSLACSLTTWG